MLSGAYGAKSFLDPRTKLLLLVTLPTFLWGGAGGEDMLPFFFIFPALSLLLLLTAANFRAFLLGTAVYVGTQVLWNLFYTDLSGVCYTLLYILYGVVTTIMPCALMGVYVLTTTTASEFISGMNKLHIPKMITIPLSVMFRFFPTVGEEVKAVNNAMHMRGIKLGGSNASKMIEYRLVPIMMCSLRIGDELSAAALTRGLDAPVKRTNIYKIGFRLQDAVIFMLCLVAYAIWILGLFGIHAKEWYGGVMGL